MLGVLRPVIVSTFGCLLVAYSAQAQESAGAARAAINMFLDCAAECDEDFVRTEITVVNYVRDRRDADVHVLVTGQPTGGGGVEYTIQFIGLGRFEKADQTLMYVVPQTSTDDERRKGFAEALKRGLVRYVADSPLADRVVVTFLPDVSETDNAGSVDDPWNLWVFRTTFTGTFNGERSTTGHSVQISASASRTSDAWRVSFATSGDYRSDSFELPDTTIFRSITKELGFTALVVKSLDDHWSMGVVGDGSSSTFLNYDFRMRAASGIEYNVFPYSESTHRMLTAQYTIGMNTFDYREETIFGQLSEQLVDHRLGVYFTMLQPWGSAGAQASFTQFVARPDKYNVSVLAQTNVRLAKGFSLNTFASISRTLDQLYLPKGDATPEEILVRERQLATSYRYSLVFGVTYTFGSMFNNVVNPRFGIAADDF